MENAVEKTNIKFLQCSDIHLDAPYVGISAEKSEERRRELRRSFNRLMQYVRDRGVDVVLMCGDIFDTEYATNNTAEVLIREFKNCSSATFIITPGSSDAYENNPIYTSGRLPSNCKVITDPTLTRIDLDELNVTIYGWAFQGPTMTENPLYGRRVDDISRINIVCGYADLDGPLASEACPISETDIKDFGADLYYTVYDDTNVIARRIVYINNSDKTLELQRAYSFAIGLPGGNYDMISLYGGWARERYIERVPLHHGVSSVDSKRSLPITSSAS